MCRLATAPFLDGVVIHDARSGSVVQLNHTAARVWSALRNGGAEEVIARDLVRTYGGDLAAVRRDVEVFIGALDRAGLYGRRETLDSRHASQAHPPQGVPALDAPYRVGEFTVRVTCYPAGVAAGFAPLAAPARQADDAVVEARLALFDEHGAFVLTRDGRFVEQLDTAPAARWALVRELVSTAPHGRSLALLHAGAVLTPAGCMLICGESGVGKSTLLAGLVQAGFPFVADDIAPLEEGTGLVWPVRVAISVKQRSWPVIRPLFPELAGAPTVRFGGRTMRYLWPDSSARAIGARGYPVAAVLFPRYAKGMPATLSRLETVRSLALLGEGGSVLPATDGGLAEFLPWWSDLPAYGLSYGRLDDAIREVSSLTDRLREGSERGEDVALAPGAFVVEA